MDVSTFRSDFPEFADPGTYQDGRISFYLKLGLLQLGNPQWAAMGLLDRGLELFIAHHLVLDARNQAAAMNGAVPGQVVGAVNSKSVDKVSVGYDTGAVSSGRGGHWNMTSYGLLFDRLANIIGIGGLQTNVLANDAGDNDFSLGGDVSLPIV